MKNTISAENVSPGYETFCAERKHRFFQIRNGYRVVQISITPSNIVGSIEAASEIGPIYSTDPKSM